MAVIEKPVEIKTADGTADGYLYANEDGKPRPGIIHLQDILGITAESRGMAKRLAESGYTVLLPNEFYRTGKPPLFDFPLEFGQPRTMQRFQELVAPLTPEAQERDSDSYVSYLTGLASVSKGKIGVIGYCFSGAMALRAAATRSDKIGAAVSFHGGGLLSDAPASPHRLLPRIKSRLYFGHAVNDRSMSAEAIEKLGEELAKWGGKFDNDTYDGALHGWTVPGSPVYNHPQAERAFEKLTDVLSAVLN